MSASDTVDIPAGVPESLHWYFRHPGAWPNVKDAIVTHDKTCSSLEHVWAAFTGGVSGFGEQADCLDCGVTFLVDGLTGAYAPGGSEGDAPEVDADGDPVDLCDCCGRARRAARTA